MAKLTMRRSQYRGRIVFAVLILGLAFSTTLKAEEISENNNPFCRYNVAFNAGYEGGAKIGGIFDIGGVNALNVGLEADFPVWHRAGEEGGFVLYVGPRFNQMLGFSEQIYSGSKSYSQFELSVAAKPLYSFKMSQGYIAPYVNLVSGLSVTVPRALGMNLGIWPGVQYFLNNHFGVFAELGFRYHYLQSSQGILGYTQMFNGAGSGGLSYVF